MDHTLTFTSKRSYERAVVGAGTVGGYFGGCLAQAGRDGSFLVRQNRVNQLETHGLKIVSPRFGDFTAHPKTVTASKIASTYDLILLSVKTQTS